jgi:hypothetical protein
LKSDIEWSGILVAILFLLVISPGMAAMDIHVAKAAVHAYNRPCQGTDVDTGGIFNSCCPQGMENPFHNRCMTSKEYAKALQDEEETDRCVLGHALGDVVTKDPNEAAAGIGCHFDTSP